MGIWSLFSGHRRRRIAAAVALLVAVAVVAGIVAGTGSSSPAASGNSASTPSGATTVQPRDLVQTDTESGTLSYASPQTVYDRLSGTITWLPKVGQVVKPGQPLFKVNGEPVTLMDGTTPAYRDLNSSDSNGQDILELNRNLVRLGFNPDGITVDDTWQAATTAGVEALQAALGESETGSLSLGRVVFLPGDQLVSTVSATLGSTGRSGQGNSSPSSSASDLAPTAGPEFASLETHPSQPSSSNNPGGRHKPQSSTSSRSLQALVALLKAEIAELKAANKAGNGSHSGSPSNGGSSPSANGAGSSNHGGSPSSSNSGNSSSNSGNSSSNGGNSSSNGGGSSNGGSGSGNASAVLQTTSTQLIVTVDLDASKQSEAKAGEPVTVQLPNGTTVDGRITAVSPVAQSSSNSGSGDGSGNGNGSNNGNNNNNSNGNGSSNSSGSTIPVTISLQGRQAGTGLDHASVSVNFAQAEARNVLSVPVTALLATGGGGYAVQEAAAPHRLIPVTTGLFAAGYVQISSQGIHPGLAVTDSQG